METSPIIPNTVKSHEAAEFARDQGGEAFDRFHRRVLEAYWGEGQNIGLPDVLCQLAGECGLDPEALRGALSSAAYASRVEEAYARARALGVTGIPTFILADQYAVVGAQEYEVLKGVMEQLGVARK